MATKLDNQFTPGGRLIMGSLTEKQTKDFDGKLIPEEKQRYFFGVAVPKDAPGIKEIINALWQMAATDYAQVPLVMAQINLGLDAKDFAWKVSDGDTQTYDKKTGQLRTIPDYMKGCYVFKFATNFEVSACDVNGNDINRADIKNGDYVDVMFNATTNGKMDDTAGIYLNPNAIRRLGYGDPISTGMSASQAFANRAASVPAGATAMPTAGGATPPPAAAAGNGAQGQMPSASAGGMPGAGTSGAAPSTPTASPHTDILNGPGGGGGGGGGMPGM